jgi:hypothetical protein
MYVNRYAPAVVTYRNTVVAVDYYFHPGAITSYRFVNTVVHYLIYQMVQSFRAG